MLPDETGNPFEIKKIDTLIELAGKLLFKQATKAYLISEIIFKLSEKENYTAGIAHSHFLNGAALFYEKDYVRALRSLEYATDEFAKLPPSLMQQWVTLYAGIVNFKLDREVRAKQQLSAVLKTANTLSDTRLQSAAYFFTARYYLASKEVDIALAHFQTANNIALAAKHYEWLFQIAKELSKYYKKQNDPAKSLEYFEAYHKFYLAFDAELSVSKPLEIVLDTCHSKEYHISENVQRAYEEIKKYNLLYAELSQQCKLVEEHKERIKTLERQIREDSLTGLQNRRYLDLQLSLEFERARRYGNNLTLVMADIDHFKQINDRFSHLIGDKVLKEIAKIFRRRCRRIDIIARYGGEEFVLLLPMTDAENAYMVCERIRVAIENYHWSKIHPELSVTISMGISDSLGIENNHDLLAAADKKLYEAKNSGRNRVCY
ncbi:GGDEF domain-containing protein [Chloroherpeton thalassium]|nr:GGDEF domain-containing protein [Chloroherpeton thalassium]